MNIALEQCEKDFIMQAWLCHGNNEPGLGKDLFQQFAPSKQKKILRYVEEVREIYHQIKLGIWDGPPKKTHFVYFIKNKGLVKIGCTAGCPEDRIKALFPANHPHNGEVTLLHTIRVDYKYDGEKQFHHHFAKKRVGTSGEWFALTDEDIEIIKKIKEI